MEVFIEVSTILIVATIVALVMKLLRQPFIVGYILTGVIVGPYVLNIIHSQAEIEFLSKIGITMLLFIVGLGLNPTVLKELGRVSIITGLGQVLFTAIIGYGICRVLGLDHISSIYVATALTFSSTIIILKLLTDTNALDTLFGKIAIGFLLVQDLVASLILIVISTFAASDGAGISTVLVTLAIKGGLVMAAIGILSTWVFPRFLSFFASNQELLFISSLTWGLSIAALFQNIGLSLEIGALIAGISLSTTPFATEIASRQKPLRDFFILQFFILLGAQMKLSAIPEILLPSILLSLFVIIGNPLVVVALMNILGYKQKVGFMAGLTVAQISEFSLILIALGISVGHIPQQTLSLVTLVGLITISLSTYMIIYANRIYPRVKWLLSLVEFKKTHKKTLSNHSQTAEVILFGFDRAGSDYLTTIKHLNKPYLVVDYNPKVIDRLQNQSIPFAYGDAEDPEFLEEIRITQASVIISTIPSQDTNRFIVQTVRSHNKTAIIIVNSHQVRDAITLYDLGASFVVMPLYLGARYATKLIEKTMEDQQNLISAREHHLTYLQNKAGHT